jgi:hypothetical protein
MIGDGLKAKDLHERTGTQDVAELVAAALVRRADRRLVATPARDKVEA